MLIRVLEGTYDSSVGIEPKGREIWTAEVEDLTAAAFSAAGTQIDPGTWYELQQFKALVNVIDPTDKASVFSTVSIRQSGVDGSWTAIIEVAQYAAVHMVCCSVIEHVEHLKKTSDVWVRVE